MAAQAPPTIPKAPPPVMSQQASKATARTAFTVSRGVRIVPQRILIYGSGGIGKTTLAAMIPGAVFLDIDAGSLGYDVPRVSEIGAASTLDDVRAALACESLWTDAKAVVIDTATKLEELATVWTIANVRHEKGQEVVSVEGYGFGKGYQHVYDTFLRVLADLDRHVQQGRHAVLICHDCTADVPNPTGEDWIRYEPRLQSPKSGRASIRHRVKEWADHVFFVGYDVATTKDGKGRGGGTRTIYTTELPTHLAKSRKLSASIPFTLDSNQLWEALFNAELNA